MPLSTKTQTHTFADSGDLALESEELRLRDELLAVVAHDLRSPIGAISIFCELLLQTEGTPLSDNHTKHVEMINEAASKAQRILDEACEMSKIYRGTLTLMQSQVDVVPIVAEAAQQLQKAASLLDVTVSCVPEDQNLKVLADQERLSQVVSRVIEEAVMSCGRGGSASVRIYRAPERSEVVLEAENKGGEKRPGRESLTSVRGRLASQKQQSRYSLEIARRVASLLGGRLEISGEGGFRALLTFPENPKQPRR